MNGLNVHDEMKANGSIHHRVLVVLLRSNLTLLQPQLQDAIAASFGEALASKTVNTQGKITMLLSIVLNLTPIRLHRSPGFRNGKEYCCPSKQSRLLWRLSL